VLPDTVRRFLDAHAVDGTIVVAVSGGFDSTALLVALHDLAWPIVAAHVNHHLRGSESDADEAFVRELCDARGIALDVADGTLDPAAIRDRGIEAAAREVRHARLHAVRERAGARCIATAHHKNDQAETVLMRLMTGSSIAALRGIHAVRDDGVIRPLLGVRRSDIERFLAERGVPARFDRSNADPRFLRNRVRALLANFDESAIDNLAAVADQAAQQWRLLEQVIDAADRSTTTADETRFVELPDDTWLRQAIFHRHIRRLDPDSRDVSAADLRRLSAGADAIRRVSVTKSLELIREGDALTLRKRPQLHEPIDFEFELTPDTPVFIPHLGLTVKISKATQHAALSTQHSQCVELPHGDEPRFTVRNRRDGDRIRPLGLPSEKKLKDLLIDRKIDAGSRDRIPLILRNGTIVWVAGVAVSERFRVTGAGDRYEIRLERAVDES